MRFIAKIYSTQNNSVIKFKWKVFKELQHQNVINLIAKMHVFLNMLMGQSEHVALHVWGPSDILRML